MWLHRVSCQIYAVGARHCGFCCILCGSMLCKHLILCNLLVWQLAYAEQHMVGDAIRVKWWQENIWGLKFHHANKACALISSKWVNLCCFSLTFYWWAAECVVNDGVTECEGTSGGPFVQCPCSNRGSHRQLSRSSVHVKKTPALRWW